MANLNSLSTDWNKFYQMMNVGPEGRDTGQPVHGDLEYEQRIYGRAGPPIPSFGPPNLPAPALTSRSVKTYGVDSNGNPIIPQQGNAPIVTGAEPGWGVQTPFQRQNMQALTGGAPDAPISQQNARDGQTSYDQWGGSTVPHYGQMYSRTPPVTGFQNGGSGVASLHPGFSHQTTTPTGVASTPKPSGSFLDFLGGAFSNKTPPVQTATAPIVKDETRLGYAGLPPDPTSTDAERAITEIMVRGGSPQQPLRGMFGRGQPPAVPLPRDRPLPPAQISLTSVTKPSGGVPQIPGPITFKKGDTVGKLAKARGMTVSSFADLYGIANPNKIFAGQTVSPVPPIMPRTPNAAQRWTSKYSGSPAVPTTRDRQLSEGRDSQLDEFGMIR